jgi:hypothetical protein
MFYAAVILILIGLLSLLYIVITSSVEKKDQPAADFSIKEEPVNTHYESYYTNRAPAQTEEQNLPDPVSFADQLKESERKFSENGSDLPGLSISGPPLSPADTLLDKEKLKLALRSLNKKELKLPEPPAEEPQILVTGVLFFDHGRQFPERMHQLEDMPERFYHELKRAGTGNLLIKGKKITIHCQNAQYNYNTRDLEQILFLPKGVGFIPLNLKRPVPIFLTEDSAQIRSFIRQHSLTDK